MIIELDVEELLSNRYDIKLKNYWKLSEEEKVEITEILFSIMLQTFDNNPSIYTTYMNLLKESIEIKSDLGEYEKADILNRLKNRILETFIFY